MIASGINLSVSELFNRPFDSELTYWPAGRYVNVSYSAFLHIEDDPDEIKVSQVGHPKNPGQILGFRYAGPVHSPEAMLRSNYFESTNSNNRVTFDAAGEIAFLIGVPVSGGELRWRVLMLDGATLGSGG